MTPVTPFVVAAWVIVPVTLILTPVVLLSLCYLVLRLKPIWTNSLRASRRVTCKQTATTLVIYLALLVPVAGD